MTFSFSTNQTYLYLISLILSVQVVLCGDIITSDIDSEIIDQYQSQSDKSLLWGPYRSNLYVGITPRIPETFLSGLMWHQVNDYKGAAELRHSCEQGDNLKSFGWEKYDPRYGGRQVINDESAHYTITTDFVKTESGNWGLKVKGTPYKGFESNKISMIFYAGVKSGDALHYAGELPELGLVDGDVKLIGFSSNLGGGFDLDISDNLVPHKKIRGKVVERGLDPNYNHCVSLKVPTDSLWRAKDVYLTLLKESFDDLAGKYDKLQDIPPEQVFTLRDLHGFEGNLNFVQRTFKGDFEYNIIFNSELSNDKITNDNIGDLIESTISKFDSKFISKFQLASPFNGQDKYFKFAKEIVSQLLGGIGYFHGDQLVDREAIVDDVEFTSAQLNGKSEGPYTLFTAVPSRPFFPRGFYWDEGFHLLPVLEFDSDLALEIIKSWFDLIDDDGWIAREQILGDEARSKVPFEFTVQNPNIANPPTLMLTFTKLLELAKVSESERLSQLNDYFEDESEMELNKLDKLQKNELGDLHLKNPSLLIQYANEIYPTLQKHYEWFRRTQKGELSLFDRKPSSQEAYRWKGRTKDHCLPSGIDDFPRCEPDVAELNVDLLSWIGVMTRAMEQISYLLGKVEDSAEYSRKYENIVKNLDELHWSETDQMYCDLTTDDYEEDEFECHLGYVTLLPFFNRLIPVDSAHLKPIVESIKDPKRLWSDFGIRSLSLSDKFYGTGENYWRGPVWINMNYLALESLLYYGTELQKEHSEDTELIELINETYKSLRVNVVNNIVAQYDSSGYAWEQYNDSTGEGQRTKHFLGWTSLVVLMMKMPEKILQ